MTDFAALDGEIWLDGCWVPWQEAKVHVLTHTLHYGLGVFEGIRAYPTARGPAIFRLVDHVTRLFNSAKVVELAVPFTPEVMSQVICESVTRNQLESAYVRPLVFLGSEGVGLHSTGVNVHVMVAAWQWGAYFSEQALHHGLNVKIASSRRIAVDSLFTQAKINGQYVNSTLALHEAKKAGYDETLLLDRQGFVAEGSGQNFFIVRDGVVVTPQRTNILPGITRATIMQLCSDLTIPLQERNITRDEVYMADEAFFTGTASEVVPIHSVDNRQIGPRGPITQQLQRLYFDIVRGKVADYQSWLEVV